MLFERLRERLSAGMGFVEPCLPSPAKKPPAGSNWFTRSSTTAARRDPVGIRLITRRGNDWTQRYPLVVEGVLPDRRRGGVLRREGSNFL